MALKQRLYQVSHPKDNLGDDLKDLANIPKDIDWVKNIINSYNQSSITSPLSKAKNALIPNHGRQQVLAAANTAPTPTPTPTLGQITQNIQKGFIKYGIDPNTAQQNAQYFAQAGQGLPDPYLPATIALKESSGGKTSQGQNNWINIMSPGTDTPVDYPDMQTALLGGNGHAGFKGIMNSGIYNDYLKSGNLNDFFSHYTPASDPRNADYSSQIQTYNQLRSNFTGS